MRVLVLTNLYPPHHYGGYELTCQWVVERWRQKGHAVEVVTGDHRVRGVADIDEPEVTRGLHFYWRDHELVRPHPWQRLRWERANQRILRRVLDRFAPDIVSVWNHGTMSYALLATAEARRIPMALVVADDWLCWGPTYDMWTRMFEDRGRTGRVAGRVVRAITRIPTHLPDLGRNAVALYASTWLRDRAARDSRFRFERETVVPWGIDQSVFAVTERPTREFRWQLLLVGRVDERKGVYTAVRALTGLPDARLELVGPATPAARARLEDLTRELGVADRVTLREVRANEVRDRYLAADVALFPSEWDEPFGLVGLEAMACGVPLVATGTGGSADYLRDGENAVLVPPGDSAALAAAIRRLASAPELRARLTAGGASTASAYSAQAMAETLETWHLAAIDRI